MISILHEKNLSEFLVINSYSSFLKFSGNLFSWTGHTALAGAVVSSILQRTRQPGHLPPGSRHLRILRRRPFIFVKSRAAAPHSLPPPAELRNCQQGKSRIHDKELGFWEFPDYKNSLARIIHMIHETQDKISKATDNSLWLWIWFVHERATDEEVSFGEWFQ